MIKKLKDEIEKKKELRRNEELLLDIQKSISSLETVMKEVSEKIEPPLTEVSVKNIPAPVESVSVTNLKDFPSEIKISNLDDVSFPKSMEVKRASWLEKSIETLGKKLSEELKKIRLKASTVLDLERYTKKSNPLAVKLVTEDGRSFYNAGGRGSLGGPDILGLRNVNDTRINPATSDNQTNGLQKTQLVDSQLNPTSLPLTAFGDLRVAELSPRFQYTFEYTVDNTELFIKMVTNGGTITQGDAMAIVNTSATTNSKAHLQSKQHAKYRSGLGGLMRFTMLFTTGVANTEQHVGITDEEGATSSFRNGFAFGYNGATFGVFHWSNDSLTFTAQSNWNVDTCSWLDPMKLNVASINFQYLGGGKIDYYIEGSTGYPVLVHRELYSNLHTVPSVYNPNFHFCAYANNKATTANLTVKTASVGYFVEGDTEFKELQRPQFSSGTVSKTLVTTEVALFTLRVKSTYSSKTNFIDIFLEELTASVEAASANNLATVRLVKNATLGGTPSWSDINTSNSVVEKDTAGTTVTGGTELSSSPLAGKNDKLLKDLVSKKHLVNVGETLTISVSSANSATFTGSLLWKELF